VNDQAAILEQEWATDPRWASTERTYSAADVVRLRGSVQEQHTLAQLGAERLWSMLHDDGYVATLGALTGNQAVQQVKAGLRAIYLSGWQVAADANLAGQTYPDQSLYPVNSVPQVVRRINNALLRADQISWSESADGDMRTAPHWLAPIVADAEAGFGGVLNAYELMKSMIAAGAAGVHWEDQLASEKKCGHLGGKVLIPTGQHIKTLNAARLAADVCGAPSLVVARTDAHSATLLTSDVDEQDRPFVTGDRTAEGFFRVRNGMAASVVAASSSKVSVGSAQCLPLGVRCSAPYKRVLSSREMPGARWFEGAELNYAEHVFRNVRPDEPAVLHQSELRPLSEMTWSELREKVAAVAAGLADLGVGCAGTAEGGTTQPLRRGPLAGRPIVLHRGGGSVRAPAGRWGAIGPVFGNGPPPAGSHRRHGPSGSSSRRPSPVCPCGTDFSLSGGARRLRNRRNTGFSLSRSPALSGSRTS